MSATLSGILPEQPTPDEKRRMSIETVLSWPVFSDQSPNTYLKSLLNSTELDHATSAHADTTDEVIKYDELLQRFLDNVFIYNPVVEENTLQQYIRDIDFHGFGFDAKTCLLVRISNLAAPRILTALVPHLRQWVPDLLRRPRPSCRFHVLSPHLSFPPGRRLFPCCAEENGPTVV